MNGIVTQRTALLRGVLQGLVALLAAMGVASVVNALISPEQSTRHWADTAVTLICGFAAWLVWVLVRTERIEQAAVALVTVVAVRLGYAAAITYPSHFALIAPTYVIAIVVCQALLGSRPALWVAAGSLLMTAIACAGVGDEPGAITGVLLVGLICLGLYLAVGLITHFSLGRAAEELAQAQRLLGAHERARQELREREEQFRALADSSATGIVIQQDGHLVYGNPHFADMARCPSADVFGLSLWDFFSPEDAAALSAQLDRRRSKSGKVFASREALFRPLKGPARWCEVAIAEAMYWQKPAIVANLLDVTERVEAQLAVKRERDFSNNIINTADAIIMVVDGSGHIVMLNPAGERITGYTAQELRNAPYWEKVVPPERRGNSEGLFKAIRAGKLRGEVETVWVSRGGDEITIAWRYVSQSSPDGKFAGMVAVGVDVTQQRILERQAMVTERLRALGQIAGGVAHDLNNTLGGIMGPAELMLMDETDEERQKELNAIVAAAKRGAETVRRIQRFSKARTDMDKQVFDLRELADDVIHTLRPRWRDAALRQGITIRVRNEVPAGLQAVASSGEIGNVLTNLIVNACEAMPQGGEIVVDAEPRQGAVEFRVRDTGTGMTEEVMSQIFQPFFSTKGADNSGLGLAVIRGIMLRHGGTITVSSQPGEGTTFTLTLPSAAPTEQEEAPGDTEGEQMGKLKVLVVDDTPDITDFGVAVARRLGHDPAGVYTGEDALQRLQAEHFDVLLTDYGMEGISGDALAKRAQQLHPEIAVVMMTGWDVTKSQFDGFEDVLRKPFTVSDLKELLDRIAAEHDAAV
jgi:PAS domain S-box-containing protein